MVRKQVPTKIKDQSLCHVCTIGLAGLACFRTDGVLFPSFSQRPYNILLEVLNTVVPVGTRAAILALLYIGPQTTGNGEYVCLIWTGTGVQALDGPASPKARRKGCVLFCSVLF